MRNKKILSLLLVSMFCIGSSLTVGAADLVNSTPSSDTDITVGEDVTQGKKTEYVEKNITDTEYVGNATANVYATKASVVSMSWPFNLSLDGNTGDASFRTGAKADISGNQEIIISTEPSFVLKEVNAGILSKPDITATVNLDDTSWNCSQVNNDMYNYHYGKIHADLTSGSYYGQMNFHTEVKSN